jgi:predicted dehydrogenase
MIKAGIIGLGYWGPNLLRNFCKNPNIDVVAAADPRPEARANLQAQYPIVRYVEDGMAVIDAPEVEAVAIATPVHTHYALAKAALESGKHVWIEKPLTDNVEQAAELVALAEKNDLVLLTDHTFVYTPAVEKLKDLILRGEIGDVYYYDSVRVNLGLFQNELSVLWDLGPHDVSIMQHLIDRPMKWVQAVGARHAGQSQETLAYITVQFEDNVIGHVHVNWLAPAKIRQVIVGGSKRMCIYDDNEPSEKVKVYDKGVELKSIEGIHSALVQYRLGDMHAPALPNQEALARATAHFAHCIKSHTQPITDGRAGLSVVQVLEAAQQSMAEQGRRVYFVDPHEEDPTKHHEDQLVQMISSPAMVR